jgi:hypothetical protein
MFLTLDKFLAHFPPLDISKSDFEGQFTVMYTKPQTLAEIFSLTPVAGKGKGKDKDRTIIKGDSDLRYLNREAVTEYFYEIIVRNRHKYLSLFYESYFASGDPTRMKWSGVDIYSERASPSPDGETMRIISLQKNDASRRLIRNLFYLELLDLTQVTNTVKSHVSFWGALDNMYNHLQLEDRFFAPSSVALFLREKGTARERASGVNEINYHNLYYLLQAYQPKASIFNPYSICWIMENVLLQSVDGQSSGQGASIFTPVLSWGSYLTAFMHSSYREYVGVDVMPSVCDKVSFLGDWYRGKGAPFSRKTVEVRCQPSESLLHDSEFLAQYRAHFDVVLVCPPYFDMEVYHEGSQSIALYPDYATWLEMYWRQTVEVCKAVSRPGGVFAMIINDYKSLDGREYPLVQDLHSRVLPHFQFLDTYYLQNRTSPLRVNAKDRTERLFVYRNTGPTSTRNKITVRVRGSAHPLAPRTGGGPPTP